mgnify:CR=1 FL=1
MIYICLSDFYIYQNIILQIYYKNYNYTIMESDYIIDFERLNELTCHENDDPSNNQSGFGALYIHSISRKVIKEYMEIYQGRYNRSSDEKKVSEVIETLHFNRILISKSDIRDGKLKKILE